MKLVKPCHEILTELDELKILKHIEKIGRVCYKSEDKITEDSCVPFAKMLINKGHESVLEHFSISVRLICDRAIANELVRHRLCSISQESTRFVSYNKDKLTFIIPEQFEDYSKLKVGESKSYFSWFNLCVEAEAAYMNMLAQGQSAQQARAVLPLSLKTELIVTTNLREWRHIFNLRCQRSAHPDMRRVMIPLFKELKEKLPVVFYDMDML